MSRAGRCRREPGHGRVGRSRRNLTGVWQGRYFYPRGAAPVAFTATIIETATRFTGTVSEPSDHHPGEAVSADIAGTDVSFVKTYEPGSGYDDAVAYSGRLNADATVVEGTWRIRQAFGSFSGTFVMSRPRAAAAAGERKVAETADA
ncbi:MAG: hypothetical protein ACWA6X_14190 [Bauldia sp.]